MKRKELINLEDFHKEIASTVISEAKKGNVIYTILRSVSRSGMSRKLDVVLFVNNEPLYLNGLIEALGLYKRCSQTRHLKVSGCGSDMGFEVVYNLSRVLFREFKCFGSNCPSNDHRNNTDIEYTFKLHSDGGYSLKQRWL